MFTRGLNFLPGVPGCAKARRAHWRGVPPYKKPDNYAVRPPECGSVTENNPSGPCGWPTYLVRSPTANTAARPPHPSTPRIPSILSVDPTALHTPSTIAKFSTRPAV
ncbi:hypothetical protein J6590_020572 [Homalodisca vitripennis]|nr:hypothetical protein J6590_020572 [Homalodisca vitripennis]